MNELFTASAYSTLNYAILSGTVKDDENDPQYIALKKDAERRLKEMQDAYNKKMTSHNTNTNIVEISTGMTNAKFNVIKLKDCKYFIEDLTYDSVVDYDVELLLYPAESKNVDCAIITVHPSALLPIETYCENGVVHAKTICMSYEFRDDSQRFADFIDKYVHIMLDSLKRNIIDVLNRNGYPMVYSTYEPYDEETKVTQTKEEINALIDDYITKRHSMANLLWYLEKLSKEERDELY